MADTTFPSPFRGGASVAAETETGAQPGEVLDEERREDDDADADRQPAPAPASPGRPDAGQGGQGRAPEVDSAPGGRRRAKAGPKVGADSIRFGDLSDAQLRQKTDLALTRLGEALDVFAGLQEELRAAQSGGGAVATTEKTAETAAEKMVDAFKAGRRGLAEQHRRSARVEAERGAAVVGRLANLLPADVLRALGSVDADGLTAQELLEKVQGVVGGKAAGDSGGAA